MHTEKILIIGANGQLGTVLTQRLQEKWGLTNVIASDIYPSDNFIGKFEILDATNFDGVQKIVKYYKITQIYHLAAVLSANGEKDPLKTWDINMKTLFNVLEASRLNTVEKVFFPSSIAVFGDNVQKELTPQDSILTPATVYGMSKVAGENWIRYYHEKYGLDVRSIRYPGVIGYQSLPGGGTTDYAVDIYHKVLNNEPFECFLKNTTTLPMIYMEDAIRATIELMDAPNANITVRTSYNLAGMSFNPEQIAETIQRLYPDFEITYKPDFRQLIADSWPQSIDDSCAYKDWNWTPNYNLDSMTADMFNNLKRKED
ncbi:NAD-dependent epimerase/dehydratase family protein [Gelidibacter maritimus]|uniref:NAD-dependent epimerase/dehydratase family protein n=1 Tax=Gelidibacter maritimus TaxID=2761487 RepID=A0A7W2R584_9FLAO|nr:NAD-dependent epimerase/dehydratase family protein [Gelidibacter maritimus]MBA6154649.1 NAD-dependent epimerase/dehydratase family protein [Gelidibacter maritimus]